jgi:hypothetical protein
MLLWKPSNRFPRTGWRWPQLVVVVGLVVLAGYVIVTSHAATNPIGDINGDGVVNVFDLSIMLSDWGTANTVADLNHDGTVGILDLSTLLSNWGQIGTPPPSGTPTPSTLPPTSPSPSPSGTACSLPGNGNCGPYGYHGITNSNGYNTYVSNQMWGCGTPGSCGPETMLAYNPGNWSVTSTQAAGNTGVLTFPDVQQLTNNWGTNGFNGSSDMPISGLSALTSTYAETMNENSGTFAESAYDIWTSSGEVMIWVDTTANRGSGGAQKEGTGTIGGIPFTYYVYGGPGGLPIIKLNTNQRTGTINILDGLHYFQTVGAVAANATISQINFGWEICSTGGVPETFQVSNYTLTMTPN